MAKQLLRLFEPQNPVRGMRSYPYAAGLPKGIVSQSTNIRIDQGVLTVRNGAKLLTTGGPPAGTISLRGAWIGTLNGTNYIVCAYRNGSYTRVYTCDPSAFTYTEITADGTQLDGAYAGNTRFPTDGLIEYSPVTTPSGNQVLVIQNGTDYPRIFNPAASAPVPPVVIHEPVTVPNAPSALQAKLTFPVAVTFQGGVNLASTHYGYMKGVQTVGGYSEPSIQIDTSTSGSVPIVISAGGGVSVANSKYIVVICQSGTLNADGTVDQAGSPTAFNLMEVVAVDATGIADFPTNTHCVPIWTPATSQYAPVYIPDIDPNDPTKFAVAFSLAGQDLTQDAFTAFIGLQFYYQAYGYSGQAPGAKSQPITVLAIYGDGGAPGGCNYGISYFNSSSNAESPGQIITNTLTAPIPLAQGSPYSGLSIPNSEFLNYNYLVSWQNTTSAQMDLGVNQIGIYRLDPGEFAYDLVGYSTQAIFNAGTPGNWVTTNAGAVGTYTDTTPTTGKNATIDIPPSTSQVIPVGSSLVTANDRLFVGGVVFSGAPSNVWVSRFQNPFRFDAQQEFVNLTQPDLAGPATVSFPGETVMGMIAITSQLVGVNTVLVMTNANGYLLEGSDSVSLSTPQTAILGHGCPYPRTLCNHMGTTYFIDDELQVRIYRGGETNRISRMKIDDKLANGTLTASSMAVMLDKVYLSLIDPSQGGTSLYTEVLIYDEVFKEWIEDDYSPSSVDCAQLISSQYAPVKTIYAFSAAGNIFQLETPGQTSDAGAQIEFLITTQMIHAGYWQRISTGRIGIACDPSGVGGTPQMIAEILRRNPWNQTPSWPSQHAYAELDISSTPPSSAGVDTIQIWGVASSPGLLQPVPPGFQGLAAQFSLAGSQPSGWNLYSMVVEWEPVMDQTNNWMSDAWNSSVS